MQRAENGRRRAGRSEGQVARPISANLIKASAWRMYFSSRRDSTIVAWHEVPGKRPPKEPSRRVRYDRAQLIPEVFLVEKRVP